MIYECDARGESGRTETDASRRVTSWSSGSRPTRKDARRTVFETPDWIKRQFTNTGSDQSAGEDPALFFIPAKVRKQCLRDHRPVLLVRVPP